MQIHHIAIWVENLEVVRDFYLQYFDCRAGDFYHNPTKKFTSCFISFSNESRIELMKRPDIKPTIKAEKMGYTHLAIQVGTREDVNRLSQKIENDGFIIVGQPRLSGDGYYESAILDPEGNRIELLACD